ncbi:MAG TPA: DUF1573 domain-containing protein [Planctomycetaceae bacterium]
MKTTPFGYVVAFVFGIVMGIAIDDQLLQPAPAVKPPAVIQEKVAQENAADEKKAEPAREPAAPAEPTNEPPVPAVLAEPNSGSPLAAREDLPKIEVDKEVDFGDHPRGEMFTGTVRVKNVGTAPLELSSIRSGCDWMKVEPHRATVEPGESVDLELAFHLHHQSGPTRGPLFMNTNDPRRSHVTVMHRVNSISLAKFKPAFIDFGDVHGSEPLTKSCQLTGSDGLSFHITGVSTSDDSLTAEVNSRSPTEHEITVTLSPSAKAGPFNAVVRLKTDQTGAYEVIVLPVRGRVTASAPP